MSRLLALVPLVALCACEPTSTEPAAFFAAEAGPPMRFALPLAEPERFPQVIGVDHDPLVHDDAVIPGSICSDYLGRGFPSCYDEHDGSDFILQGGFSAMDDGSTPVIAAADGVVVSVEQDQYDRCRADAAAGEVSCDGNPIIGNHVILEHPGGVRSKYWHLATASVRVSVGDEVRCGDALGLVGSSGNSSMPHLHFEVALGEGEGETIHDPFAEEPDDSWWLEPAPPDFLPGGLCP